MLVHVYHYYRTIVVQLDGDGHAHVRLLAPCAALLALGRGPGAAPPERRRETRALHAAVVRGTVDEGISYARALPAEELYRGGK